MKVIKGADLPVKHEMSTAVRVFMKPKDELANVSITRVDIEPGSATPEHSHDTHQIVYVLEGELLMISGEVQERVAAGDLIYIPPGEVHQHRAGGLGVLKQLALFVPVAHP
ncbi:MAG: cupin domain-containing protein [Chloroflexota bacterium]